MAETTGVEIGTEGSPLYIAALIATRPRWQSLMTVSLPSLTKQRIPPQEIVVVADHRPLSISECDALRREVMGIKVNILHNSRLKGAAGSWNTGLANIRARRPDAFVAILDDDDEWDIDHLEQCVRTALADGKPADIVVSGLRIVKDGKEIERPALHGLSINDFLIGNPGWQGSNTFARAAILERAGDFTDGLQSMNDRDLAIRVLSLTDVQLRYTGRMTSTWHLGREPDTLSKAGSPEKRRGIEQFIGLYGHLMSPQVKSEFSQRCRQLFDIDPIFER